MKRILDRISYFAVYDDSILSALDYARDHGFTGVQIPVELPHFSFDHISEKEQKDIRACIEDNSLRLILHGHDDAVSLFEANSHLLAGTMSYYQALFSFAESTAAQLVTIHLGALPVYPTDTTPEQQVPEADRLEYRDIHRNNLANLTALVPDGLTLCVENYKLDPLVLDILQEFIDNDSLALCWDLPKMYDRSLSKYEQLEDYFWRNITHVKQVHLHDLNAQGRSHRVIGSGEIDFIFYLSQLCEHDVLDYCIEARPRELALQGLINLKKLIWSVV